MLRINQVKIKIGHTQEQLHRKTAELLHIAVQELLEIKIIRQSIDARRKPEIFYSYSLDVKVKNEAKILHRFKGRENLVSVSKPVTYSFPVPGPKRSLFPVVIVGMGPAGLFCASWISARFAGAGKVCGGT